VGSDGSQPGLRPSSVGPIIRDHHEENLPLFIVKLELKHMTSLPLSFRVRNAVVEKHQLEGMDPSDRYFNRMIPIKRVEHGYSGTVMYEALNVESLVYRTVQEVLKDITDQLRELGFTTMRTRLNFKGQKYLAEKETWGDYPDA
jgi:hypothetical protein